MLSLNRKRGISRRSITSTRDLDRWVAPINAALHALPGRVSRLDIGRQYANIHIKVIRQRADDLTSESFLASQDFRDRGLCNPGIPVQLCLRYPLGIHQMAKHICVRSRGDGVMFILVVGCQNCFSRALEMTRTSTSFLLTAYHEYYSSQNTNRQHQ